MLRTARFLTLVLAVPVVLAGARTRDTNPMSTAAHMAEGRLLYRINCGVCHGMDGKTGRGARLAKRSYRRGNSDAELFDLIEAGVPGTDMPGLWLEEDDIWKILLFVRTFAGTASESCESTGGDAGAGKVVFESKGSCLACHTVGMEGGRLGPDMSYAGATYSNEQIRDALLVPHEQVADQYRTVRLVAGDGESVEGILMQENLYNIYVLDRAERIRSFRKSELQKLDKPEESLMPAYGDLLSAADIDDLVEYLCTLVGKDREDEE